MAEVVPAAGLRGLLRSAGARDLRALWLARLASQGADGVFEASLVGFALFSPQDAPDARAIAGSLAAVLLPFSLVGPFAGIALDRVSRQRVLLVSAVARGLLMLGVAALMVAGQRGVPLIVLAVAVLGVARFTGSALSAALPLVVPRDQLVAADSLTVTTGGVASLLGLGIGAGVRLVVGSSDSRQSVVALAAGAGYVLAAVAAAQIAPDRLGPHHELTGEGRLLKGKVRDEVGIVMVSVADGARHLWERRPARRALAAVSLGRIGYGLNFVATILLFRVHFAAPGSSGDLKGLAAVGTAGSVGYVLGALATPPAARRLGRPTWMAVVLTAAGVAVAVLSLPFVAWLLAPAAFVLGFAQQAAKVATDTLVQEAVDDEFRGRAFSFYDLAFNACYVIAAGLAALVLPPDGKSVVAVGLVAGCYLVAGIGSGVGARRAEQGAHDLTEPAAAR